jgi:hypothetical protein
VDDTPATGSRPVPVPGGTRTRWATSRTQGVGRIVNLSRDQEYAIIRGDLRRLLTISAVLLVAMVALLLILPD